MKHSPKARHVKIYADACGRITEIPAFAQGVEWEIVSTYVSKAAHLAQIPQPRLRRLQLLEWTRHFDLNPFLDVISQFTNLIWLDYEMRDHRGDTIPILASRSPIILPNLQVLWYKNRPNFEFPFSMLILPSLRYLSLNIYASTQDIPLIELMSCYRQTLRSFVMRSARACIPQFVVNFPAWNTFPELKEFILDQAWAVQFPPLTLKHPLQRLDVNLQSFDVIPSLLEGENMRRLTLQCTRKTDEGGVIGRNGEIEIDVARWNQLVKRAEARGVQVEVVS
ncbi:hypothetical protein CPB86DRAFT_784840 [Serendipita vermifera]|nr:hypothetical protein CPB86DRAFT_784840 [Serendipita vermifera]